MGQISDDCRDGFFYLSVCISSYEYIEQELLAFDLSDHFVLSQPFPGRGIALNK